MVPRGCQFTIFLGFNWHPFEGASIDYIPLSNLVNFFFVSSG